MANQERTIEADGRTYVIRFTQNAIYRLEKELGRPIAELNQSFGMATVQVMLWAGLEGARLKHEPRNRPFTVDDAGDIIEAAGFNKIWPIVLDAWQAAWPTEKRDEPGSDEKKV